MTACTTGASSLRRHDHKCRIERLFDIHRPRNAHRSTVERTSPGVAEAGLPASAVAWLLQQLLVIPTCSLEKCLKLLFTLRKIRGFF